MTNILLQTYKLIYPLTLTVHSPTKSKKGKWRKCAKSDYVIEAGLIWERNRCPGSDTRVTCHGCTVHLVREGPGSKPRRGTPIFGPLPFRGDSLETKKGAWELGLMRKEEKREDKTRELWKKERWGGIDLAVKMSGMTQAIADPRKGLCNPKKIWVSGCFLLNLGYSLVLDPGNGSSQEQASFLSVWVFFYCLGPNFDV